MHFEPATLESLVRRFRRDIWKSVTRDAVVESGVQINNFGPVQVVTFGEMPFASMVNQIHGAAEPGAVSKGYLAEALEWIWPWEVDFRVAVASCRPEAEQAEKLLESCGCEPSPSWTMYVRGSEPPPPVKSNVVVWELGKEEWEGEGLSQLVTEAMEYPITAGALLYSIHVQPGWHCYTAQVGQHGSICATGAMMIDGDTAVLGADTTIEEARKRGCNKALLRRRIVDAIEAGCTRIIFEAASEMPEDVVALHKNLEFFGFEPAYESRVWKQPALHPAWIG